MIKLVIVDENQSYIGALSNYLQGEYGNLFDIMCLTTGKVLNHFLSKGIDIDILLIDENISDVAAFYEKTKITILMTENAHNIGTSYIYKYQKAENIAANILEAYDRASIGVITSRKNEIGRKLLCVYSSAGGAGKTTVAYNLAVQYAMQQKKVLFLSLESYSSLPSLARSEDSKGIIYLLYLIKNKMLNLQLKLVNIKMADASTGVHYIGRESNLLEYKDIAVEDIMHLADFLRNQGPYDVVVFDLDSAINDAVLGAFKCCDAIINVLSSSAGFEKNKELMRQIPKFNTILEQDISRKLVSIINKYSDSEDYESDNDNNCKVFTKIPYSNSLERFHQAYYPEMSYFKELYDILENFA